VDHIILKTNSIHILTIFILTCILILSSQLCQSVIRFSLQISLTYIVYAFICIKRATCPDQLLRLDFIIIIIPGEQYMSRSSSLRNLKSSILPYIGRRNILPCSKIFCIHSLNVRNNYTSANLQENWQFVYLSPSADRHFSVESVIEARHFYSLQFYRLIPSSLLCEFCHMAPTSLPPTVKLPYIWNILTI
jgi:hypothetical protein